MRFDHFMQHALHDPQSGYYARKIKTVGHKGDFSTTATLSPILGKAIAENVMQWLEESPGSLNLIEIGAGDGSLAESLMTSLPFHLQVKLSYRIVETSIPLTVEQQKRLRRYPVKWFTEPRAALAACSGRAFIFSNELVDAFPVRIFQKKGSEWEELFWEGLQEVWKEAERLPDSSALCSEHPEGHRIEVHAAYQEWLASWVTAWREGVMLTVDYGDTYPAIYHQRPQGTVRAFRSHENITGVGIYQNVGQQDLTADVNFTDLMQWGNELGLETVYYDTQATFLEPYASRSTQDFYLLHPDGPGSVFKVLLQRPRM